MAQVYLPDSAPGPDAATLAPSPASLAGLRIAVLDNGKPNARLLLERLADRLAELPSVPERLAGLAEAGYKRRLALAVNAVLA